MNKKNTFSIKRFGYAGDREVSLFQLSNGQVDVEITNYGATIVSVFAPDRNGIKKNIVAGFSELAAYQLGHPYMGCIIGRFTNRISNGFFSIDGLNYQLPLNDPPNHLHGGVEGFNRKVWEIEKQVEEKEQTGIQFSYLSRDGEEGYPGNVKTFVTYLLTRNNQLIIRYEAVTDKATIISLTNHSYFNLTGFDENTIYDHYLQLNADSYTVKSSNNTSSGDIAATTNTPFYFSEPKKIGKHIDQLITDMGYDHNFILNKTSKETPAACLYEEQSGRLLKIFTDQPGIQVYTSNWWNGKLSGYQGCPYQKHGAVALETQAFPDAPNHAGFPNSILRPGETYSSETTFQFSTIDKEDRGDLMNKKNSG